MMTTVDPDSFEEWSAHPITETLMRALLAEEDRLKELWVQLSLEGGSCDQIELAKFRERRGAYRDIREMTAQRLEELLR